MAMSTLVALITSSALRYPASSLIDSNSVRRSPRGGYFRH